MSEQITRLGCPLGSCDWHHDDPGPSAADAFTMDAGGVAAAHAIAVESIIREHLEAHPLIEWAREVARLRDENQRADRDATLVVTVLLRRLGGSAELHDADLAAASGTLVREPVPDGFRLSLRR